jgi:hypothetical protein
MPPLVTVVCDVSGGVVVVGVLPPAGFVVVVTLVDAVVVALAAVVAGAGVVVGTSLGSSPQAARATMRAARGGRNRRGTWAGFPVGADGNRDGWCVASATTLRGGICSMADASGCQRRGIVKTCGSDFFVDHAAAS